MGCLFPEAHKKRTVVQTGEGKCVRPRHNKAQIHDSSDRCEKSSVNTIHQYLGGPTVIFSKGCLVCPERPDQGDSDHEISYGTRREPHN